MCSSCRPHTAQEAALQALCERLGGEAPPTDLLQGLLAECLGADELRRAAASAGNQLAACWADTGGSPEVSVCKHASIST